MLLGRDFSLFFIGSTMSAIGTAMVPVALSFALLEAGRSAGSLGVVLAAQTVPIVILLLLGGVAGDRWPRRRIMIGSDLLRFAAQSSLAASLIHGAASMPVIITLTALTGAGTAFFYPARSGLIAQIVDVHQLARANGALSAANSVATILGPPLAGVIVIAAGAGWAISIDGASYAASCLVPESRDATLTRDGEEALWQAVFMAAPERHREFEPSSKRRKRRAAPWPGATG
jgi:MFS family permease